MSSLIMFVPLVMGVLMLAGLVKLAARIRRGATIRWAHCLVFSALLLGLSIVGQWMPQPAGIGMQVMSPVAGLVLTIVLGGWFFRGRGMTETGQPFVFVDGIKVMAITVALGLAFGLAVAVLFVLTGAPS